MDLAYKSISVETFGYMITPWIKEYWISQVINGHSGKQTFTRGASHGFILFRTRMSIHLSRRNICWEKSSGTCNISLYISFPKKTMTLLIDRTSWDIKSLKQGLTWRPIAAKKKKKKNFKKTICNEPGVLWHSWFVYLRQTFLEHVARWFTIALVCKVTVNLTPPWHLAE